MRVARREADSYDLNRLSFIRKVSTTFIAVILLSYSATCCSHRLLHVAIWLKYAYSHACRHEALHV